MTAKSITTAALGNRLMSRPPAAFMLPFLPLPFTLRDVWPHFEIRQRHRKLSQSCFCANRPVAKRVTDDESLKRWHFQRLRHASHPFFAVLANAHISRCCNSATLKKHPLEPQNQWQHDRNHHYRKNK